MRKAHAEMGFKRITYPVILTIHFGFETHKGEADLSNLLEGPQDCLEDMGIIQNDKLIYHLDDCRKIFGSGDFTEIWISALSSVG